jgi:hypothetical protein
MAAIQRLLARLGYVRLDRYGLVLTPEQRILTLRPVVLDDGLGNKIIGWEDHDLAAMELEKWEPFRPASQRAVATRVAAPPPPVPPGTRQTALGVAVTPPSFAEFTPALVAYVPPSLTPPPPTRKVADLTELDDDEWEWTIALARARAAAEEAEAAAVPVAIAATPPPPVKIDYATPRPFPTLKPVTVVTRAVPPPIPATRARVKTPATVIPVPRLPAMPEVRVEPVVRMRIAKGTGPVNEPPPPIRAAEPELPTAARAITLPSIKQRLAR